MGLRIGDLADANLPLDNSELMEIEQSGNSRKLTLAALQSGVYDNLLAELATESGAAMVGFRAGRTVAQRLSESVSVWDFAHLITNKPTPNNPGTWDWLPAINAAIASLATTGGEVLLSVGDFGVSEDIEFTASGVSLVGQGHDEGRSSWGKWPTRIYKIGTTTSPLITIDPSATGLVRGCQIKGMTLDCQDIPGVAPFYAFPQSSHCQLKNVCLRNYDTKAYVGTSCYGWLFEDVEIFNSQSVGIEFEGLNHHTTFIRCRAAGTSIVAATAALRIGISDRCSSINFIACDWEAENTTYQVELLNCRAVSVVGGYSEWVAGTVAIFRLGVTGTSVCAGFSIAGFYVQGNDGLAYALDIKNASGVCIGGGCHFRNIVSGVVNSTGACPESSFPSGNHLENVGGAGQAVKFAAISSGWTYYERGTKTVTLVGLTTPGSNTYAQQKLAYTIANGVCTFALELELSALSSVGALQIHGLPVACVGLYDFPLAVAKIAGAATAAGRHITASVIRGSTTVDLKEQIETGSGYTSVLNTEITATFAIFISGSYQIA